MKRLLNRKNILRYLYDQLTGNFAGFLIGMSASGLVSQFFETRGLRNLWGLTARKTVVSKDTFGWLEWTISILIGFIVFEIITKVLKERLDRNFPKYKRAFFRWIISRRGHTRLKELKGNMSGRSVVFFTAVNQSVRKVLNR